MKWVVTICALTYSSLFFIPTFLLVKFLKKLKMRRIFKIIISVTTGFVYWYIVIRGLIEEIKFQKPD